jgi:hypothetical protein
MALSSLVIELEANVARLQSDMAEVQRIVGTNMQRVGQAANDASKQIENVARAGHSVGRVKGVDEMAEQMNHLNFSTVGARRELLVLAHEAANGNWKRFAGSLMVLGERVDAMSVIFSKTGLMIGGFALAIGAVTLAAIAGYREMHQFNTSLILTGNYAGMTAGAYNEMAKAVAEATGHSIGSSREAVAALTATGAFTRSQLQLASADFVTYAALTGAKTEEVAKDYGKMSEGVAKWAEEHNRSMHYLSASTYEYIKSLEEQGKIEQAVTVNLEALHERAADAAVKNLGTAERMWRGLGNAVSSTVDALKSIGRPLTTDDKIERLEQLLRNRQREDRQGVQLYTGQRGPIPDIQSALANLYELKRLEEAQADRAGTIARQQQAAMKAGDELDGELKRLDKAYAKAREIEATKKRFSELAAGNPTSKFLKDVSVTGNEDAGFAFSGGLYDRAMADIEKRYRDRGQAGIDRANLDARLRPIEDSIREENKLLAQRDAMLKKYYEAGMLSISDYYKGVSNATDEHLERIRSGYAAEAAIVRDYSKTASDERQRIEASTKAKELETRANEAITADLTRLNELVPQQARDVEAYRQEVVRLNAELAKLKGNLGGNAATAFDRAHEKLTRQASVSGDAGTLATLEEARRLTVAQGDLNELKQQAQKITENLKTTEDGYRLAVDTGQLNELDGMLRISQARQQAATDLGKLADQVTEIAMQSGDSNMLKFAQQFDDQVKRMQISADTLGAKFDDVFSKGLATALVQIVDRTKTWQQAVMGFANTIEKTITDFAANALMKQLFSGMGGFFAWIAGLFGGALVDGGDVQPGRFYEVAERGPELLHYANRTYLLAGNQAGAVTPMSAISGGGGRQSIYHMNINVPAGTSRQTAQQQAAEIMRHAQIAQVRNQ